MTSFFSKAAPRSPFSIDDAFDIPEEDWDNDQDDVHGDVTHDGGKDADSRPIIKNGGRSGSRSNGYVGLDMNSSGEPPPTRWSECPPSPTVGIKTSDSASLVNSAASNSAQGQGESGYYEGRNDSYKHWWHHPKIRANFKLVIAAIALVVTGAILIITGIVAYCVPSLSSIQGVVFIIAGLICLTPGAYHLGYIYLALKGKRGFDFNHLPLFNN